VKINSGLLRKIQIAVKAFASKVKSVPTNALWDRARNALAGVSNSRVVTSLVKESRFTWSQAGRIWSTTVDVVLRLKIRVKLSLIVGASIVVTTLIISTIATELQERELRLQTHTLGITIVQLLGSLAKDNLLLNSDVVLQDYINNVARHQIRGLEHLYVINREGIIVAHIQPDSVRRQVSLDEFTILTKADTSVVYESADRFRFVQAVYFKRDAEKKKIFLGSCSASFSKTTLQATIDEMRSRILFASFGVSIIAIGVVYYISKKIVRIIIVLSEASRRVGMGDLKVDVVTRMKDELGMLARDFNLMVVQIREKTEMQKFVSKSTMEMIATGEEAKLGGLRKPVTALFTDIRGFTSFSEKHSPEEVIEMLNLYLDVQTQIIQNHDGVVDKFLGDGIMSVFTGEDQTQHAIEAAIHIQRELAKMNQRRRSWKDIVLEVGIGIAAGEVVLGSIGSHDRMDYTAIGDTVNLASRLCGIAGASEIVVTEEVVGLLGDKFRARSEGKLAIKGKQHQVPVYKIPYQQT
jgi:class 3 adenylate cyclase